MQSKPIVGEIPRMSEGEEIVEVPTTVARGKGLCAPGVKMNLFLMIWLWVATSTVYMIINFYIKYMPGSVYLNFSISGLSEIAAHIVVGALFNRLTPRWTFFIGYVICGTGSGLLIFQNRYTSSMIASFLLLTKFGISMALCACYVSTPFLFPTILCGTAFGICNICARFVSIGSPVVAELTPPLPMMIFCGMSIISVVVSLFISKRGVN